MEDGPTGGGVQVSKTWPVVLRGDGEGWLSYWQPRVYIFTGKSLLVLALHRPQGDY